MARDAKLVLHFPAMGFYFESQARKRRQLHKRQAEERRWARLNGPMITRPLAPVDPHPPPHASEAPVGADNTRRGAADSISGTD